MASEHATINRIISYNEPEQKLSDSISIVKKVGKWSLSYRTNQYGKSNKVTIKQPGHCR